MKTKKLFAIIAVAIATTFFTCEQVPDHCAAHVRYDPDIQFCYNGEPYVKCGGRSYDPQTQGCIAGRYVGTLCADGSVVHIGTLCGPHLLSVAVAPEDGGIITNPANKVVFDADEDVVLHAQANSGFEFAGWVGGADVQISTGSTLRFSMRRNTPIIAMFRPSTNSLIVGTFSSDGRGGANSGGEVDFSPRKDVYDPNELVTVTAVANDGFIFEHWTGASTSTNPTITITMSEGKTLVAIFRPIVRALSVSSTPRDGGLLFVNGTAFTGEVPLNFGNIVNLLARANDGFVFSHWSGSASGSNNPLTINLTNEDRNVIANFTRGECSQNENCPTDLGCCTVNGICTNNVPRGSCSGGFALGASCPAVTPNCTEGVDCENDRGSCTEVVSGGVVCLENVYRANCAGDFGYNGMCSAGTRATFFCNNTCTEHQGAIVTYLYKSAAVPTPVPTGCYMTSAACQAAQGQGTGTTGACCVTGQCYPDVTATGCANAGGTFQGAGTTCSTNTCVGSSNAYEYYCVAQSCEASLHTTATPPAGCYTAVVPCMVAQGDGTNQVYCCYPNDNSSGGAECYPISYDRLAACTENSGIPSDYATIERLGTCGWAARVSSSCIGVLEENQMQLCQESAYWYPNDLDGSVCRASIVNVVFDPFNPNIIYGEFTDSRDGKTYRTVVIGSQTWMAENLKFNATGSWCNGSEANNCNGYGRHYDWVTTMQISTTFNNSRWNGSDVRHQGICPDGWWLPSDSDWDELMIAVGGVFEEDYSGFGYWLGAGKKLKSSTGWEPFEDVPAGTDDFGFSALPGGRRSGDGFAGTVAHGYWWSATEGDAVLARFWNMWYGYEDVITHTNNKRDGYSVRCVRD